MEKLATKEQLNQVKTELEKQIKQQIEKLATKQELHQVKTDLEKQIAVQSTQLKMLTWATGINATATIAILILLASQAL